MKIYLRDWLDRLYLGSGIFAAMLLFLLLFLVLLQMSSRWFNITIPGLANYAGYCMGGVSGAGCDLYLDTPIVYVDGGLYFFCCNVRYFCLAIITR